MCTNRWGTYKAHSNHQLWSQQPNTQKSPNYSHDNYKSSSFSELFGQGNYCTKSLCAMCTGTKADFSQCKNALKIRLTTWKIPLTRVSMMFSFSIVSK